MKTQRHYWGTLCVLLFLVGACNSAFSNPPEFFIDRGACPGECCTYGKWRADQTTGLYGKPIAGSKIVGQVKSGSDVHAQTGEVHTNAGKFVVRKESPPYKPGDVIWIYTYLGEGYYKVWRAGEIIAEEISVMPDHKNPDDWGYYDRVPDSQWWIKLKTKDGLEGWTNTPRNFSGTHSCG